VNLQVILIFKILLFRGICKILIKMFIKCSIVKITQFKKLTCPSHQFNTALVIAVLENSWANSGTFIDTDFNTLFYHATIWINLGWASKQCLKTSYNFLKQICLTLYIGVSKNNQIRAYDHLRIATPGLQWLLF